MARSPLLKNLKGLLKIALIQEKYRLRDQDVREARDFAINRRDFLHTGLLGFGLPAALSACQTAGIVRSGLQTKSGASPMDITVVGAGTAGLSCAYYLAKAGQPCRIYEGSLRVGGRMQTLANFNAEGMFCELGGEFVDTQHDDLISLCLELGLPVVDLAPSEAAQPRAIYFSHQKVRSEAQILDAFKPLASKLLIDIKTLSPQGELQVPSYRSELSRSDVVLALDRMSLAQYLEISGIESWLKDLVANAYVGEYGLEAAEQSALNLIVLMSAETDQGFKVFGSSDEAKRIVGGSESLPRALAKHLQSLHPITFEYRLLAVQERGHELKLVFDHQGKTIETSTKSLVLALPAALLRDLDLDQLALSSVKRLAINTWGIGSNSKLMLGFSQRVWDKNQERRGFSLLPDQLVQEFWDTSLGQIGNRGIVTSFLGGKDGLRPSPSLHAKALAFLEEFFPGIKSNFDGTQRLQHWPSQPFAKGSYTCSRPGQYTSIYGSFAEPELQGRLVFAGEHCSTEWSGYMNGAVQSGRQAAASVLKRVQGSGTIGGR